MYDEETWVPSYDDPSKPGTAGNFVRFITGAEKNETKSASAGRPIFDNKFYVEIRAAGVEKQIPCYEIVPPDPKTGLGGNQYYQRYGKLFDAWRAGGIEGISGTPLTELPFLSKAEIAEIKGAKINSAEALAGLAENTLIHMGPGFRQYHEKAKLYLKKAADMAPLTDLQKQIDDLKNALQAERDNNKNLAAAVTAQPKKEKLTLNKGEAA